MISQMDECSPLLVGASNEPGGKRRTLQERTHDVLEAKTRAGRVVEALVVLAIVVNIVSFILSTEKKLERKYHAVFDGIELATVVAFTVEYVVRLWAVGAEPRYSGFAGRCRFVISFFSLVDLAAIVPFYVDLGLGNKIKSTAFIRVLRLFRMLRVEGRYLEAFTMFDDVIRGNSELLATSGFVGGAVWVVMSALFYLAERNNPKMVVPETNHSRYGSIPSASYYTLLNLFGEFPNVDDHSAWGKVVATFVAVVAVAVFAIPAGILGSGFSDMLEKKREERKKAEAQARWKASLTATSTLARLADIRERPAGAGSTGAGKTRPGEVVGDESTQGRLYNFMHAKTASGELLERFIFALIILNVISFVVGTLPAIELTTLDDQGKGVLWYFELFSVLVFTVEYGARLYSEGQDPRYAGLAGRAKYLVTFFSIVDLASIVPFYVDFFIPTSFRSSTFIRALRLTRMLKGEQYIAAFTVFDDVVRDNVDILAITGFSALVTWIIASTLMWVFERDNPVKGVARYYQSVGDAMWITLLNLTGESPLSDYTPGGKVVSALVGVFAVGYFTIPIGILGAGFEDWVSDRDDDVGDDDGDGANNESSSSEQDGPLDARDVRIGLTLSNHSTNGDDSAQLVPGHEAGGGTFRARLYGFLQGQTAAGSYFVGFIVLLILLITLESILTTVDSLAGHGRVAYAFNWFEGVVVIIFSVEYVLRVFTSPENPAYRKLAKQSAALAMLRHLVSFYALVDLLAILPWYLAVGGVRVADEADELLRMLRLLRLLALDRYVPSVSLLDDVLRRKANGLIVAGFATVVLWVTFATLLFLAEHGNTRDYGDERRMATRFRDVPNALQYTLILLTGDYPMVNFSMWGKVVNALMILAAVGVVGVPAGLICSGFTDIIEEQKAAARADEQDSGKGDDDSGAVDDGPAATPGNGPFAGAQRRVHAFLSGEVQLGRIFNHFILGLIVANVLAVILESEPVVERALGSVFWNVFETFSVVAFTVEYVLRLFAAVQDTKHGYSRLSYATSFFGVIDFAAITPFYVELVLQAAGVSFDATIFRILRLFRIFQVEHFMEAFTLLDDVYRNCEKVLKATGLLALVIWVGAAALFYVSESRSEGTPFTNMPNALYYTAVFLGGEWGRCDFNILGKFVSIFLAFVGIALFSVPIGFLFEAFNDVLDGGDDDDEGDEEGGEAEGEGASLSARNAQPSYGTAAPVAAQPRG